LEKPSFFSGSSLLQNPLYDGAPLSTEESMYTTYLYAIKNKLSYQATNQLLDLMRIHFPSPNFYPQSFHTLKKHLAGKTTLKMRQFCSGCLDEIPQKQKHCGKRACKHSGLSFYAILPFEEHLGNIFSGTCMLCKIHALGNGKSVTYRPSWINITDHGFSLQKNGNSSSTPSPGKLFQTDYKIFRMGRCIKSL